MIRVAHGLSRPRVKTGAVSFQLFSHLEDVVCAKIIPHDGVVLWLKFA
jgi:hypothetical protein